MQLLGAFFILKPIARAPKAKYNIGMPYLISVLSLFIFSSADAKLVSVSVGQVKERIITSREVVIHQVVERELYGASKMAQSMKVDIESQGFAKEVNVLLMEWVVFLEAQALEASPLEPKDLEEALQKFKTKSANSEEFKVLKPSEKEIQLAVERKLRSKKFIQLKMDTSTVPVTDAEAEKHFQDNRLKFGNLPFENFKANIKTFLTRQQTDKRLKDWFEILQVKYQMRNFLAEI